MAIVLNQNIYDGKIENALSKITSLIAEEYGLTKRAIALLLLQGDQEIQQMVADQESSRYQEIENIVMATQAQYEEPFSFVINWQRQQTASQIAHQVMTGRSQSGIDWSERLSRLTMRPLTGIPILLLVLYYGLYQFVGVFGAGTIVEYLESHWFESIINPWIDQIVSSYVPWPIIQELLAKDYGILTLALRYAVAIVLPIVGTFFIVFSIIEDTGYLPRLSLLVDRVFKGVGLSGRAVIPMTLGFGCDTMATMVSRTLETTRERVIATLLLALAIPCSAQLGVIMAILSGRPWAMAVWIGFMLSIFLLIGWLTAKILPGDRPSFYMELPPLRWPSWRNVLTKTYTRMQWYLLEVIPLFIWASVLIWIGNITGALQQMVIWLIPVVNWIGLPAEAAQVFLFGFFRRDYGAAGLFDLYQIGIFNGSQLVVAAATLTLFVPCIAQFTMMVKERGLQTAVAIAAFIFPFAFLAGYALNWLLRLSGVSL